MMASTLLSSVSPAWSCRRRHSSPSCSASLQTPPPSAAPLCSSFVSLRRRSHFVSLRRRSHVVRMAPDEERITRRNPLDFPMEWERPRPGRRPDIFPQFSPMKTPLPPPMPFDPNPDEEDEWDEEEEEQQQEEEEEGEEEQAPE